MYCYLILLLFFLKSFSEAIPRTFVWGITLPHSLLFLSVSHYKEEGVIISQEEHDFFTSPLSAKAGASHIPVGFWWCADFNIDDGLVELNYE